jgi:hypothetical protein
VTSTEYINLKKAISTSLIPDIDESANVSYNNTACPGKYYIIIPC